MRIKNVVIGTILLLMVSGHPLALAATEQLADPVLRSLYQEQLQRKEPSDALTERIGRERTRIRQQEQKVLDALIAESDKAETDTAESAVNAIAQQQALVDALTARRQEAKVDHDLLDAEESTINQGLRDATPSIAAGLLRRKADLYSRRAVFEERMAALDQTLQQQEERLSGLETQERLQQFKGVITAAFYIGVFLLIIMSERLVRRRLIARIADRNRRYLAVKMFTGAVYVTFIIWVLYRLSGDYPGFLTSFAIVGAGIAVALQAVIKDIVGWILIVQKRLFRLGERVTIGKYTGDVADISLFRTTMVEVHSLDSHDIARSGQTLYVPNSLVLEGPVLNFHATSDFVEAEIPVRISAKSDWRLAEKILLSILEQEVGEYVERARRQHALRTAHFFAAQEPPSPRVFVDLNDDTVLFTLRFQIPIGRRRTIGSNISKRILEQFGAAQPRIEFAKKG